MFVQPSHPTTTTLPIATPNDIHPLCWASHSGCGPKIQLPSECRTDSAPPLSTGMWAAHSLFMTDLGLNKELGTGKYQGGTYNVSGVVNNKDLRERVHDRHVTGMLEYERGGNLIRYASLLHPHPSPRVVVTPFFICYLVIQQLPLKHPDPFNSTCLCGPCLNFPEFIDATTATHQPANATGLSPKEAQLGRRCRYITSIFYSLCCSP